MFNRKLWPLFLCGLFAVSNAWSAVLVEPYVGYHAADGRDNPKSSVSGLGYGLRAGLDLSGLIVGGEYHTAKLDEKFDGDSGNVATVDYDFKNMGVFIGYQFDVGFRVYASYLKAELEYDPVISVLGIDFTGLKGNGFKVGLGWRFFNGLALNAEWESIDWDKQETSIGDRDANGNADILMFNVSFPITFL